MKFRSDLILEAQEMINERRVGAMEAAHQLPEGVIVDRKSVV